MSRQSFTSSRAKLRFRIKAPANANTIHSSPPEISRTVSALGSKAKLNSSRMTIANASDALMVSLVRHSERRSLPAMANACCRNAALPLVWRADHELA